MKKEASRQNPEGRNDRQANTFRAFARKPGGRFWTLRYHGAVLGALLCVVACLAARAGGVWAGTHPVQVGAEEYASVVGVGLWDDTYSFDCSGVLITPRHVLTAAHCAATWPIDCVHETEFTGRTSGAIRFGGRLEWDRVDHWSYWDGGAPVHRAARCYAYPDWNPVAQTGTDLMILELKSEVTDFSDESTTIEADPWPVFAAPDMEHIASFAPEATCVPVDEGSWVRHIGYGSRPDFYGEVGYVQGEIKTTSLAQATILCGNGDFDTDGYVLGGDSGSPVVQYRAGREVVVGIVEAGSPGDALVVGITAERYGWIRGIASILPHDYDSDGIENASDNCPLTPGSAEDLDGDNVGDSCDNCPSYNGGQIDSDADGVARGCDNCRGIYNPYDEDLDGDGVPDHQGDFDGDGVGDRCDNCRQVPNPGEDDPQSQTDTDGDGFGDACDNCIFEVNLSQSNCDADDDLAEGIDPGRQGDACDPDLCVEIEGGPRHSDEMWRMDDTAIHQVGRFVTFDLRSWGGEPDAEDPPGYALDASGYPIDVVAPVEAAYCECEPHPTLEGRCMSESDCPHSGADAGGWQPLTWSISDGYTFEVGAGEIPDVLFTHPVTGHVTENSIQLTWDWRGDTASSHTHAMVRFRPAGRPPEKGNTFTDVFELEYSSSRSVFPEMPPERLYTFPPALDLSALGICPPGGPCPWYDVVSKPFELPEIVACEDPVAAGSPFALKETPRAALSALAVRHASSDSGFAARYLPVRFEDAPMDLKDFGATVLLEKEMPFKAETLNDFMSIWTFGGVDRSGGVYNELYKGRLDGSGREPVYRFSRVKFEGGPPARKGAMLMADVEGRRLLLLGGTDGKGRLLDDLWVFELSTNKWRKEKVAVPESMGLEGAARQVSAHHAYVFGGRSKKGETGELWRLDLRKLVFEKLSQKSPEDGKARVGASLIVDSRQELLYVYGGFSGEWRNDLHAFNLGTRKWTTLHSRCSDGGSCPPAAARSVLVQSGVSGELALTVGPEAFDSGGSFRKWRFSLGAGNWIPEEKIRGLEKAN